MKLHDHFQPDSPEYELLHAAWRKSRGKPPSSTFQGINNPRLAYDEAVRAIGRTPWYELNLVGVSCVRAVSVIEILALQLKDHDIRLKVRLSADEILKLVDLGGKGTEWSNPSFGKKNGFHIVEADWKSLKLGRWVARLSGTKKIN